MSLSPRPALWTLSVPLLACALVGCKGGDGGDDDTATLNDDCWQAALFTERLADPANSDYPDPSVTAGCTETTLVVESNGIPDYEFVPITPNPMEAQDFLWEITLSPVLDDGPTELPLLATVGFTLSGLPIQTPNEAEMPDPYGDPVYNGILDFCYGHIGGNNDYHLHALLTECITSLAADGDPSPILGFALDGFPIYGPNGCLDTDCAEIVTFSSGWVQTGDPSTYAWDNYAFTADDDELTLDQCNGRVQPDGSYGYHATSGFPYVLGCSMGTEGIPTPGGGGGDSGGGGGEGVADCDDVAAGSPCCGDDVCDGPETEDNCPADCAG